MKAVVLCPGPSLADYKPEPCDMVVCVNRAALAHECTTWASLDYPMIRDNGPNILGNPSLLTQKQTAADLGLKAGRLERFPSIVTVQDIEPTYPMRIVDHGWWYVTMGAAIVYCVWKGAKEIKVYGADWEGKADFDGTMAGENREPARWDKERKLFADLKAYFSDVTIERVTGSALLAGRSES